MRGLVNCSKVYLDKCEFGFGVFAGQDFQEGSIVETGLMYIINGVDGNNNPHLFTWSNDRTVWAGGSGCIPFYNHSDTPNIKKVGDLVNNRMIIVALRDISKGEELRNTYMSAHWRQCFKDLK